MFPFLITGEGGLGAHMCAAVAGLPVCEERGLLSFKVPDQLTQVILPWLEDGAANSMAGTWCECPAAMGVQAHGVHGEMEK
jgi:hypothetical protein